MKIDILTLFPNMIKPFLEESILKRAIVKGLVSVSVIDFRVYSPLNNHQVDDTPYGGGAGMVLRCEPLFLAIDDLKRENSKVILFTPDGKLLKENVVKSFVGYEHLILICGHYEGIDERVKSLVDYEISLGDFILTGGEIPATAFVDALVRLIPGVINEDSLESESFNDNLLDYPVYTKPSEYRGLKVPEVLLSGNHAKINEYRKSQQLERTKLKRPDLLK